jgi:hypothetical protein
MRGSARQILLERISSSALVLDVGGWADPFERADWVLDYGPYDTRGMYERRGWKEPGPWPDERFTRDTWVARDICDREPWPFEADEFDFVICSHTLEDLRDPLWVCSELERVGRAGFIEFPSRLEEQSWGVHGPYVGSAHHRWLISAHEGGLEFVFKPHDLIARRDLYFPDGFSDQLSDDEKIVRVWWEDSFLYEERLFFDQASHRDYLRQFVSREMACRKVSSKSLRLRSGAQRAWQLVNPGSHLRR